MLFGGNDNKKRGSGFDEGDPCMLQISFISKRRYNQADPRGDDMNNR